MFEDNAYEPIAEIYLTLSGQPTLDDIYCLCSRVFVEGANGKEEDVLEDGVELEAGETVDNIDHPEVSGETTEITVRFCNSSTESQPVQTPKKTHEEAVSCYCSASHYSTDEHDSLRDGTLHHSDSGADLSESSRDIDWERYWTLHGERLIWESWIAKYGQYIDPNYLATAGNANAQRPADGDDTSFCIQSDKVSDPNRRTSFTGVIESIKAESVDSSENDSKPKTVSEEKSDDISAPKILVENIKSDGELLNRRLSDISETARSVSGRSEDSSSNVDDNDRLRLNVFSRCSGSSAPLSATTDSMTNVTRITLSSSDSSYGVDDSSAKSSSILSSSESSSSVDQQWQQLWAEHFNEQYSYHYNKFTEKHCSKSEDAKTDSGFIVDDSKLSTNRPSDPLHQESIDDVVSIDTQDSVFESDHSKPPSVTGSNKSSSKSEKSKKSSYKQRISVGYLLQQLNAMSVEPSDTIQEEDKSTNSLSRPPTLESVGNEAETNNEVDPGSNCVKDSEGPAMPHSSQVVEIGAEEKPLDVQMESNSDDGAMQNLEEESNNVRHGVKRSHERENDEASVEKVKSAYQLMGFMYDLENTRKIRKASVWYRKRFNQIRFQNRVLRLQKLPDKHIYFDDDDELGDASSSQLKGTTTAEDSPKLNNSRELFQDAADTSIPIPLDQANLDLEEFSEKDDSTDDDDDIFFSAEEDNILENKEKRENKIKSVPKRKKKKNLKKKSTINYPDEMVENPKIRKFWRRRYSLFSKFDEGIKMDAESWYSVTPEKIAVNIAERCRCDLVIDAFCGAGGNAIQLAFTCERVIAIDIDPLKIELARNNARVYGVDDRIEFIVGDFLQLAPTLSADVVFLSPPWGGPAYSRRSVFPLASLQPVAGQQLFTLASAVTDNIAFYLPRTINTQELVECAGPGGSVEVVQNFLDRELVAVTAYFGELVNGME